MPRYFFDIDDGDTRSSDDEGMVMPDAWAARKGAVAALPDIARDVLPDGDHRDFITTVRDENGRTIFQAKLSLNAEWVGDPPPK